MLHILHDLSFFGTRMTSTAHEVKLFLAQPLLKNLSTWRWNSLISSGLFLWTTFWAQTLPHPTFCTTDGLSQAVQVDRSAQVDPMIFPIGPMTRAWAKRLNESLETMVQVVQDSIDVPNIVKGKDEGNSSFMNLVQVVWEEGEWRSNFPNFFQLIISLVQSLFLGWIIS